MAEDIRLKENFTVETQSDNPSNQPQHPQQTIHTEKLLKETSTNKNIEYTIMDTSQQIVLESPCQFPLGNQRARAPYKVQF